MKRFDFLLIPVVVSSLSGCDSGPMQVCADATTHLRVDEQRCSQSAGGYHGGGGGYSWYYLRRGVPTPSVGSSIDDSSGSFTPEPGVSYHSGIARGGFGGVGEGFGGGE